MHRQLAAIESMAVVLGMFFAAACFGDETLKLWYDKPAAEWTEALPIGNGRLGAMIFGGTERERIQFNDNTLFSGRPHDYAHDGAKKHLPVLRQLLFDGKQDEAHELASREFMSVSTRDGRRRIRQEKYQPFGDVVLEFPGHDGAAEYRRELDIDRAVASVQYKIDGVTFRRELFASNPDNVIAMRITADQPGKLNFSARLTTPHVAAGSGERPQSHRNSAGEPAPTGSGAVSTLRYQPTFAMIRGKVARRRHAFRGTIAFPGRRPGSNGYECERGSRSCGCRLGYGVVGRRHELCQL